MAGSYRDELDAALRQAEALRSENQALRRENADLRAGPPQPVAQPYARPRRAGVMLLAMALVMTFAAGVIALVVVRAAPSAPVAPGVMTPPVAVRQVPTADEVARAIDAVRPAVQQCGTGLNHAVTIAIVFDASGLVRVSSPVPPADTTPVGACAAAAVRAARVAPFAAPSFSTSVPFIL